MEVRRRMHLIKEQELSIFRLAAERRNFSHHPWWNCQISEEVKGKAEMKLDGVLILEDGTEFQGTLFGAQVSSEAIRKATRKKDFAYGEVVFNTSMSGYQEILTDPSYYGQMICMTT